jgi:hypothetical protein
VQIETRQLTSLSPHPRNPRRHPPEQIEKLRLSLRTHGAQKPVVVTSEGTILAGHGLVEAMLAEGWKEAAVHIYDGPYPEAFLVIDNRSADLAIDDHQALADLLQSLQEPEQLSATGFSDDDLRSLLVELARNDPANVEFPEYDENLPDSDAKEKKVTCPECGHEFTI